MKRLSLVYFCLFALVFVGCKTIQYVPVEHTEYVTVRDTTFLRDTVIRTELQKARISDFVDVTDTLVLSTDLATATAFVDTTKAILRGTIENTKPYVEKPVQIKERIVYRDSVITKEIPVEVQVEKVVKHVPRWCWWTLVYSILLSAALGLYVYFRLKP